MTVCFAPESLPPGDTHTSFLVIRTDPVPVVDFLPGGSRPFCLLDFFPQDYLLFIDESHVTLPQLQAMYKADRSRKQMLVDYGFRLPSALDNRPLKFEEFLSMMGTTVFVSATPGDFEKEHLRGHLSDLAAQVYPVQPFAE